jgi:hypothetical protein
VLVATAVLREAVDQQENALRLGGKPSATKERLPAGAGNVGFRTADGAMLHGGVPSPDCERSALSRLGIMKDPA